MTIAGEFGSLFAFLRDTAIDKAIGQDIPLIGTALDGVSTALFSALEADLAAALDGIGDDPTAIVDAINGLPGDLVTASAVGDVVTITITGSDSATLDPVGGALDLGIDDVDFGLEGSASFTPTLSAALDLTLTYDTGAATPALTITDGDDALSIGLDVAMDVSGRADLGLLEVVVTDGVAPETPEIALALTVDIASGALSALSAASVTAGVSGGVHLDLGLRGDLPVLPDIVANFVIDWDFAGGSLSVAPSSVRFENIGIDIASMVDMLADLMDPILGFVREYPFDDIISALTEPVPEPFASIINFLDVDRVPTPDGDGKINFLDFAAIYYESQGNDAAVEAISVFAEALGIIQMLTGGANGDLAGVVELGDLDLTTGTPNFSANADALADADGFLAIAQQFQEAMEAIEGLIESVQTSLAGGFTDTVGLAFPILDNPGSIVSLLLPDLFPGAAPVIFVEYDLPALQVEARVGDFFFSILGPIGINLGGSFEAGIDFKIAYDSTGLTNPGSDGFTPDDLLKGLVLKPANPGAAVAHVNSEIHAGAGIELVAARAFVEGGLNGEVEAFFPNDELRYFDVASGCIFEVSGSIGAELRVRLEVGFGIFSWTVRKTLAETTLVDFSFGCDGSGVLATDPGHGLASLKLGDPSTLVLHAGVLAGQRSINNVAGTDGPEGETFLIGNTLDQNGNLMPGVLTVSAFGINEMYGSADAPILKIGGPNAFGNTHGASFGQGDDTLMIAASVLAAADVSMGAGNDYATGGAGDDVLRGDDGFDQLVGNGGNDQLYGGAGDDTLEGGAGADLLDGGEGRDQVTYENSAVAVVFNKAPDGSGAMLGEGGDAEGDRLVSIEYIIGSAFNDILVGNPNQGNTLEGRGGNDALVGGNGNDFLLGGTGGDFMQGGAGRDGTSYLSSYGAVRIDLLFNGAAGGDAAGDVLVDIEDVQGSLFDDVLYGNHSANRLDGWVGNDRLEGRGGADIMTGGDGNDVIYAGGDGDLLSGGHGIDLLSYVTRSAGVVVNLRTGAGGGSDRIGDFDETDTFHQNTAPLSGFENLDGSNFGDSLTGDDGGNVIRGLDGSDAIYGGDGNDTLIGGAGADQMTGGAGVDWADYSTAFAGVIANLATGGTGGEAAGDAYSGIENLRGSDLADQLTGDGLDNVIDPGLSLFGTDTVNGGVGNDTLYLNYMRGDYGDGVAGGFTNWAAGSGSFVRPSGATTLDAVNFTSIERLVAIGTIRDDVINAAAGDDVLHGLAGNDTLRGGTGNDSIYGGDGDDWVVHGNGQSLAMIATVDTNQADQAFTLYGGAGIDSLWIALASDTRDITISGSATPETEFSGSNVTVSGPGSAPAVSGFEILRDVITGFGKDTVTQAGVHDNRISTGWDVDVIKPGMGVDTIDGGYDFELGVEVEIRTVQIPDGPGEIGPTHPEDRPVIINNGLVLANPGDLLELDYSSYAGSGGITGTVTRVSSDIGLRTGDSGQSGFTVMTNSGTYSGDSSVDLTFTEIERLKVTGSDGDDVLVGTFDPSAGGVGGLGSTATLRGDDMLYGGLGNDLLIGNTGDDTLYGGAGDDVISGQQNPFVDSENEGTPEVDTLYGGDGADLFVLGAGDTVFYRNFIISDSSPNRAVIKDFDASEGDRVQLLGTAGDYVVQFDGTTAKIYHDENTDELIADIENTPGFDLSTNYVTYVAAGDPFPTPAPSPAPLMAPTSFSTMGFSTLAAGWITQTTDRDALLAALLGTGATGITSLGVTLNGEGRAFGTFEGDPFGLGSGIILSTGKVEDLAGANEIDGGLFREFSGNDLSTDLGIGGTDGDTVQFVYTFEKDPNASVDTVVFDFIMFSEELREYAGQFNDSVRILLNGVNLATLSDGSAATVNNLMASPFGPVHPDLILNPVGSGPLADAVRADGYTKVLSFAGAMQDGVNTLVIEVEDALDGLWDSGILVKGGTFKAVPSAGGVSIGGGGAGGGSARLVEGDDCYKIPIAIDPGLRGSLIAPLVITVTPSADIDLGNGAGVAKVITVKPGDPLTFELCVTAPNDRKAEGDEYGTINFGVSSSDPAYDGLPIAPLVIGIIDAQSRVTLVADHSLAGTKGPVAFGDGVTIQGFDSKGAAARLAYGDGGIGIVGKAKTGKVEGPFPREIDYRAGKSEKLVIHFDNAASDVSVVLGQFYAGEANRGERAIYTAYDAGGAVIATGVLVAGTGEHVANGMSRFDLGLNGVARVELEAADLYSGGKQRGFQSDFSLHAVSYAPTVETGDPEETAIIGTMKKDVIMAGSTAAGQPLPGDGIDIITGLGGKDRLFGLGGNDTLDGGSGKDKLKGGDGDDVLIGGVGRDKMTGGAGFDQFVFDSPVKSAKKPDKIVDFQTGEDLIVLDRAIFRKLDPGALEAKAFFSGKAAKDGNDRIGYDKKTGIVVYDKNGDKAGGDVAFAKLSKGLDIDAGDFLVI